MSNSISKIFVGDGKKNEILWTALSGATVSISSVITLLLVTRLLGIAEGGVYSIALTVAQQLSSIGNYCIRTFHSSDIKKEYSLNDYWLLRIITCFAMLAISFVWIMVYKYDSYKASVVVAMCVFKIFESYSDLYEGTYQRNDRMDVSGKSNFVKELAALISSLVIIVIKADLLLAIISMSIVYGILFVIIDLNLISHFEQKIKGNYSFLKLKELVILGLPIVVNSYLMLYINNSSKYAIDTYCGEAQVAIFNILYMPAFCINLLVSFIARPLIVKLAKKLEENKITEVKSILLKEAVIVIALAVVIIIGMYTIGMRLLSIIYSVDITPYKLEFVLVLVGGAFYAMYTIFYYMITILRRQFALLVSCIIGSVITMIIMPILVNGFGMIGASIGYAGIMFLVMLICMFFTMLYLGKLKDEKKEA